MLGSRFLGRFIHGQVLSREIEELEKVVKRLGRKQNRPSRDEDELKGARTKLANMHRELDKLPYIPDGLKSFGKFLGWVVILILDGLFLYFVSGANSTIVLDVIVLALLMLLSQLAMYKAVTRQLPYYFESDEESNEDGYLVSEYPKVARRILAIVLPFIIVPVAFWGIQRIFGGLGYTIRLEQDSYLHPMSLLRGSVVLLATIAYSAISEFRLHQQLSWERRYISKKSEEKTTSYRI